MQVRERCVGSCLELTRDLRTVNEKYHFTATISFPFHAVASHSNVTSGFSHHHRVHTPAQDQPQSTQGSISRDIESASKILPQHTSSQRDLRFCPKEETYVEFEFALYPIRSARLLVSCQVWSKKEREGARGTCLHPLRSNRMIYW
jgi:hypothetical protein